MTLRSILCSVGLVLLLIGSVPSLLHAAGGSPDGGSTGFSKGRTTPGQKAITEYREGERHLDLARAAQLDLLEARAEGETEHVAKLDAEVKGAYVKAERRFRKAIEYDAALFQAWSGLGYTLRRQGEFDAALAAYDKAIALEPRYAEAVEYRAEAYLELGRLDEAKAGYVTLVDWVRPMADRLMAKMDAWIEARLKAPGDVDPAEIEAFVQWIAERREKDGEFRVFTAKDRAGW